MSAIITHGVEISAEAYYQEAHSRPKQSKYVWAYRISITNHNEFPVQLIERHWDIWDSSNVLKIVDGEGVIGEQPVLRTGETHRYMSWCPLQTDMGYMRGYFKMTNLTTQTHLTVKIPTFSLVADFRQN